MKLWEIIYTNKMRFSNLDGKWEDAPRGWAEWDSRGDFGVFKVCVRFKDTHYFEVIDGHDQYVLIEYEKGFRLYTCTMNTVWIDDHASWEEIPCPLFLSNQVKFGRNVRDTKLYNELVQMNIND